MAGIVVGSVIGLAGLAAVAHALLFGKGNACKFYIFVIYRSVNSNFTLIIYVYFLLVHPQLPLLPFTVECKWPSCRKYEYKSYFQKYVVCLVLSAEKSNGIDVVNY